MNNSSKQCNEVITFYTLVTKTKEPVNINKMKVMFINYN